MSQKILIKVGTNVISKEDGTLDEKIMAEIVDQISQLKKQNLEIILITSGAVGAGKSLINLADKNLGKNADVIKRQILASAGQIKLMNLYLKFFGNHQYNCAQILVTKEDFRDRLHYLNMKNCLEALLKNEIVPVINENDVVSVTELMFTDNDELAGLIAAMLNVDTVIILTNVDGIFDQNPNNEGAKLLNKIDHKTNLEEFISPDKSSFGRGGMLTKSRIAQKLSLLGITTHIANGKRKNILLDLLKSSDSPATTFLPSKKLSSVKRWIAYSRGYEKGTVFINKCAEDIITSKSKAISLLPVGITKIEGDFEKGEIIKVKNEQGADIGFGMAQYSSEKAKEFLGQKGKRPLIHYDYFFLDL
jgi:glutamate 5-kinase